jgi:hypothetical protein
MVQITHVLIVAAAVIAPVMAVPFEIEDEYYPRDFVELEARDPFSFRRAARWARRTYRRVAPVVNAAARVFGREYDEDGLYAREFDDDKLYAREFDDDELYAREFDDDELYARDFDEELDARDFDDELDAREVEDELEAREPENTSVDFSNSVIMFSTIAETNSRLRSGLVARELYDDLD